MNDDIKYLNCEKWGYKLTPETNQWLSEVSQPDYRQRLKVALKTHGMSRMEFANHCGCSPSNISQVLGPRYFGPVPKYIWATAKIRLGEL